MKGNFLIGATVAVCVTISALYFKDCGIMCLLVLCLYFRDK